MEHPILFTGEMVKAILDGRKTQTRRVVKPQPETCHACGGQGWVVGVEAVHGCDGSEEMCSQVCPVPSPCQEQCQCVTGFAYLPKCPYGKPGDRLWVREKWLACEICEIGHQYCVFVDEIKDGIPNPVTIRFIGTVANTNIYKWGWHPSIHLPKKFARLWLEVISVRLERVQEISEEDASKEGCAYYEVRQRPDYTKPTSSPKIRFHGLWDSINTKRGYSWESNPFVWVVEFKRIEQ